MRIGFHGPGCHARFPTGLGIGLIFSLDAGRLQIDWIVGAGNLAAAVVVNIIPSVVGIVGRLGRRIFLDRQGLSGIELVKKLLGLLQGGLVVDMSLVASLAATTLGWGIVTGATICVRIIVVFVFVGRNRG